MRASALVAIALVTACGGSTPTSPAPAPLLPAQLNVVTEQVAFAPVTENGWPYTGQGRNTGTGCAAKITGTVTFRDAARTAINTSTFALDAARVVQPGETFPFSGCCMAPSASVDGGTASVAFTWTNVRC